MKYLFTFGVRGTPLPRGKGGREVVSNEIHRDVFCIYGLENLGHLEGLLRGGRGFGVDTIAPAVRRPRFPIRDERLAVVTRQAFAQD